VTVPAWLWVPVLVQAALIGVDELWFHRRRDLPRWERLGHPVDTLSVAVCYAWLAIARPEQPHALAIYVALAVVSSALVTKDEAVHARHCVPGEHRVHAWMFVLHPIVLIAFGTWWWRGAPVWPIAAELAITLAFMTYQIAYWSIPWKIASRAA
jgi:hypothetical protein